LIVLAAALGQLGRTDKAILTIDALNRLSVEHHEIQEGVDFLLFGPYTLEDVDLWTFNVADDRERLREGLRLAGLPETGEDTEVSPPFIPGAISIDVVEARQLYDRGVMFIDTRPKADWNTGHVAGAVLLELEEMFTEKAVLWGFEKIYYFRDGFPTWKAAEYPIEID